MDRQSEKSGLCRGTTKKGTPCKAAPMQGGLCFLHANPARAAELGRQGGRKNGHLLALDSALPPLDNPRAIRDKLAHILADLCANKLSPRVAAAAAQVINVQLRVIHETDIQTSIEKLQEMVKTLLEVKASSGAASSG